jgi:hypothetical protein
LGEKVTDVNAIGLASTDVSALAIAAEPAPRDFCTWPAAQVFRIHAVVQGKSVEIRLAPFADAGATGKAYKVWLPLVGK